MAPRIQTDISPCPLDECYAALKQTLDSSPYWSIRHLVCQIDRDRIRVQGTVSSFYLKQIAQSLLVKSAGVQCIHSEIEVEQEQEATAGDSDEVRPSVASPARNHA